MRPYRHKYLRGHHELALEALDHQKTHNRLGFHLELLRQLAWKTVLSLTNALNIAFVRRLIDLMNLAS
jgi:hypothetical protein